MKIKIKPYTFKAETVIAKAIQKAINSSEISRLIVNNFNNFVSILGDIVLPRQTAKKAAAEEEERRQAFELFKILYERSEGEVDPIRDSEYYLQEIDKLAKIAVRDTNKFREVYAREKRTEDCGDIN